MLGRGGECLPDPEKTGDVTHCLESWRSPRLCLAGLATLAGEMMKGTLSLFLLFLCLAGAWGCARVLLGGRGGVLGGGRHSVSWVIVLQLYHYANKRQ